MDFVETGGFMSALKAALDAAGIVIKSYDPEKSRPVRTTEGTLTVGSFSQALMKALGKQLKNFPEILDGIQDHTEMERLLDEYAVEELGAGPGGSCPPELSHLTLYVDTSSSDPGMKKYFCTTPDGFKDISISGQYYIQKCGIGPKEIVHRATGVVPKYLPHRPPGVHRLINPVTQTPIDYYNSYVPPAWRLWKMRNPGEWAKLPAKPPSLVLRMIQHVIPSKEERNYFYAWLYTSMTSRAYTFLVLCGLPGVGKNRLKLLIRALHGEYNSADGKKETFGANQSKFNSQMEENTLIWFDELKYGPDMEPRMKEYQNEYISIERKGQDASRSTQIFCSMVISNNYPRDNYILFNSRKFAPLVLGNKALTAALTPEEIGELSEKLDDTHPKFDVKMTAQIAKWITTIGPKHAAKWPNLEYQGPMYWKLAHTSMSRWQKIAVLALTVENKNGPFKGWDATRGAFLWSKVEEALRHKKEYESKDYRDASTVKAFFETYCDLEGKKVFEVENTTSNTLQDFWIRPIHGLVRRKGEIKLDPHDDEVIMNMPVRPPGMSEFQWRKIREEFEASSQGGLENVRDTDLL
jgi:hypothetical protein